MATTEGSRFQNPIAFNYEGRELIDLVQKTKDWALMHGAGMRSKNNYSDDALQFAPFTLLPSVFPRNEFHQVVQMQTVFNELIHKVAHNRQFLTDTLKNTIEADEFTRNLFKIYETVSNEGITQRSSLGILRSDYMLQNSEYPYTPFLCQKQVEINTIASGFGWLGPVSAHIHRFVLQEIGQTQNINQLPENNALTALCQGMVDAWKLYGKKDAVILFIVEDMTYNICDHRFHEFEIQELEPAAKVVRRNLTEIGKHASLGKKKELLIDGMEVALAYYRSGYAPVQYPSQLEWDARLLIERSLAIKCPSIQYHLAGTKKVQQVLASPNVLERLLKDEDTIKSIRKIFTGLYSLDLDAEGDAAVKMGIEEPAKFVLKPQREGGGNNVYGENIRKVLQDMQHSEERKAWILMERIFPPVQKNVLVRPGEKEPMFADIVSELGIFGVIIGDADHIQVNRQAGHMLRSKLSNADEGGVAAGSGVLDSPLLV
nr:PREDICTED: glutathione synthetase-like [Bemisia tabaci]